MSSLEESVKESQLKWEILARELYLKWAFNSETSVTIKEIWRDFASMVDWLLYLKNNWLVAEVNWKLVFHWNTTIPTRVEDVKEWDLCLWDDENEFIKMYYLTPAWKKIIDEQMSVKASVDWIIKN